MFMADRAKIGSRFHPSTYRHAHHMGSGEHIPATAEAWMTVDGKRVAEIEISVGDMEPGQAVAKAIALLKQNRRIK